MDFNTITTRVSIGHSYSQNHTRHGQEPSHCVLTLVQVVPHGLRAPALDPLQDRCMRNPIQVQLNAASLVTYDMYLLVVLCTGNSADFPSWVLQTSSGTSGWAGFNAVQWNV